MARPRYGRPPPGGALERERRRPTKETAPLENTRDDAKHIQTKAKRQGSRRAELLRLAERMFAPIDPKAGGAE
jgi:hypothetical protein